MKQVRMSLLENAYDFLNEALRSAERAGQDPKAWKFAVLHVVQAIELLLKARLHAEHPVLIYEDVDRRTRTVSLARAVDRITGAARIELTLSEQRSILKAQKWRDAIVHYEFEMSPYEVEAVFVQLCEFLERFHNEHTDFGDLHSKIDEGRWGKEAELMEFFQREFVMYNGVQVARTTPAEIVAAQRRTTIVLHGQTFDRIRYGEEIHWRASPPCHDCAVMLRQLHLDGCDVEECPRCFEQLLSCGCQEGRGPAESDLVGREIMKARYTEMFQRMDEKRLADATIGASFDN
jgi:HEPN domain-containing protein